MSNYKSAKNYWITLILCFFLGFLGVHSMYTGKWWRAVLQAMTFGGFGFWWLIDLILIIKGEFKDKYGLSVISSYHKNKSNNIDYELDLPYPNDLGLDEFKAVVEELNPKEAAAYFNQMNNEGVKFGSEKYKIIATKGSLYYEDDLLYELREVEGDEVDEWLTDIKHQGMLVSKKVWNRAQKKSERFWGD